MNPRPVDYARQIALSGDSLSSKGLFVMAQHRYKEALRLDPQEAEFHWRLGLCQGAMGQVEEAGEHLQAAVKLNPQFAFGQASLSEWYLIQGMVEAALRASEKSFQLSPHNTGIMSSRASALEAAGELDAAWDLAQQLVSRGHLPPAIVRLYARMARRRGKLDEALILVNRLLDSGGCATIDQSGLHLSAAQLLEELGRYDEAFGHAIRGNALRRPRYDPAAIERSVDDTIAYFTRERLRSLAKATGVDSSKAVFVVGMPRSGTSLVEQILSSHPQVHGAGELDFLYQVLTGTAGMLARGGKNFPYSLDDLRVDQANGMAEIYLNPLTALSPEATRIIDKMPLNFMQLGLIGVLLPQARIIHCQRHPLDTCVSCYMTSFSAGNDFKYDQVHLGKFYRQYQRLMAHWHEVLDLPILDVDYEAVVADAESQSRRMVQFLGLPWDERCVRFHETKRSVTTASIHQVRQPIYGSSVRRSQRYESWIDPLKAALGR